MVLAKSADTRSARQPGVALSVLVVVLVAACTPSRSHYSGADTIRTSAPAHRDGKVSDRAAADARTLGSFLSGPVRSLAPRRIAIDAGQTTIAAADSGGTVVVWHLAAPGDQWRVPETAAPDTDFLLVSPDGAFVVVVTSDSPGASNNVLAVWSVAARKAVLTLASTQDYFRAAWFGPGNTMVVSSYPRAALAGGSRLDLYGLDGARRASASLPDFVPVGVAGNQFSYNPATREYLAIANGGTSGSGAGYIAWRPGAPPRQVDVGCDTDGVFSPDGALFACPAGKEDTITVWDVARGGESTHWTGQGYPFDLNGGDCTFFDGGRGLAAVDGRRDPAGVEVSTVHLYDVRTHDIVGQYPLPVAAGVSGVSPRQLGSGRSLAYQVADGLDSPTNRYYAFASPSLP